MATISIASQNARTYVYDIVLDWCAPESNIRRAINDITRLEGVVSIRRAETREVIVKRYSLHVDRTIDSPDDRNALRRLIEEVVLLLIRHQLHDGSVEDGFDGRVRL